MAKQHGNQGNVHAAKNLEETAESRLVCRVKSPDKAAWVKMAQADTESKNLSEWIIKTLNNATAPDLKA